MLSDGVAKMALPRTFVRAGVHVTCKSRSVPSGILAMGAWAPVVRVMVSRAVLKRREYVRAVRSVLEMSEVNAFVQVVDMVLRS